MQKISILTLGVVAAVALEAERFVGLDGNYATAAGPAFGVSNSKGAIGERVPCDVQGTTIVTAGGAIAFGAYIDVGANGKAVTHAAGKIVGRALQAAAADGDRIEILQIQATP